MRGLSGRIAALFALALLATPAAAHARTDASVAYRIRPGDTLYELNQKYLRGGASVSTVRRINRIANPRRLRIGRTITIPRRLLRTRPAELSLRSFSGPVEIRTAKGAVRPAKGMTIPEGTVLATGNRGFLSLTGRTGSHVSLPSQSRVRVARARVYLIDGALDVAFEIVEGRGSFSPPGLSPGERYRVLTPHSVTAVRGTRFRVFHDTGEDRSGSEVVEGEVQLQAGDATASLPAGFGAAASASGLSGTIALLPAPELTDPGKPQTGEALNFTFARVDGAEGYRTQIARDAGFLDVIDEQIAADMQATFASVENGRYFVRSRAISEIGLEGETIAYSFVRQRLGVSASASPTDNGYRFAWGHEGEGDALYSFEMWREGSRDTPVISEIATAQRGFVLTDLEPGTYQWRAGALQSGPDGPLQVWANPQKLVVTD